MLVPGSDMTGANHAGEVREVSPVEPPEPVRSATARGSEYATRLGQPGGGQRGHSPAEGFSRQRVDIVKDADLQDLYVVQKALREKIRNGPRYPMKPLILQQLKREGH